MVSYPFEVIRKVNDQQVARLKNTYDFFNSNKIIELKSSQKQTTSNSEFSGVIYHNYDSYGNPIFITQNDADNVVYLWSYNGQYPVAEIKNVTYEQVKTALENITPESISLLSEPNMNIVNSLRYKLPNSLVATYKYKPLVGVIEMTDPRGVTTYYDYDNFGRLKRTYLKENGVEKTIETYDYHYHNQ
jgi:RHS Repeat.